MQIYEKFCTRNFCGLDGQKVCFKQRPIQDKIVLSPLIIKGKIKTKFQSVSFTEVNVKINKIYKDNSEIIKPDFIRLRSKMCKMCQKLKILRLKHQKDLDCN